MLNIRNNEFFFDLRELLKQEQLFSFVVKETKMKNGPHKKKDLLFLTRRKRNMEFLFKKLIGSLSSELLRPGTPVPN